MPRFYLHLRADDRFVEDPEGSDLPSLEAARADALASAREFWADAIRTHGDLAHHRFEICDADRNMLLVVPFSEALPPSLKSR